jgi:hypothetical protein
MKKGDYVVVADGEVWSIDYNSYMKLREQSVQLAHMLGSDVLFVGEADNINAIVGGGVGDVPGLTETPGGWTFRTNTGSIVINGSTFETYSITDSLPIRQMMTRGRDRYNANGANYATVDYIPYFTHNGDVYINVNTPRSAINQNTNFGFQVGVQLWNSSIPQAGLMYRFVGVSGASRQIAWASHTHNHDLIEKNAFDKVNFVRGAWSDGGFTGYFRFTADLMMYSYNNIANTINPRWDMKFDLGITNNFMNLRTGLVNNIGTTMTQNEHNNVAIGLIILPNTQRQAFRDLLRGMTDGSVVTDQGADEVFVPSAPPWWREVIDRGMEQGLISRNPTIAIDADKTMTVDGVTPDELARQLNMPPITIPGAVELPLVISKFPFSLPWDLYEILTILIVPAKDPVFVFPLKTEGVVGGVDLSIDEEFVLDLTRFRIGGVDMVREIIRFVFIIGFVFMLIKVTPKLLK